MSGKSTVRSLLDRAFETALPDHDSFGYLRDKLHVRQPVATDGLGAQRPCFGQAEVRSQTGMQSRIFQQPDMRGGAA